MESTKVDSLPLASDLEGLAGELARGLQGDSCRAGGSGFLGGGSPRPRPHLCPGSVGCFPPALPTPCFPRGLDTCGEARSGQRRGSCCQVPPGVLHSEMQSLHWCTAQPGPLREGPRIIEPSPRECGQNKLASSHVRGLLHQPSLGRNTQQCGRSHEDSRYSPAV